MKKLLALPLFLFLLVSTIPVHAYLPIDLNVSYSGGLLNHREIACTNSSGTFYCYTTGTPSGSYPHTYIERWNATFSDRHYCDTGHYYVGGSLAGMSIANSTHLIIVDSYETAYIYNITDEAFTDHTCNGVAVTGLNRSNAVLGGGYDAENGLIYWGGDSYIYGDSYGYITNGIRNATTNTFITDGFWSPYIENLKFPDQSNSTILYGMYGDLFFKYIGGAFDSNPIQMSATWGVSVVGGRWDLWKISDDTTWLYVYTGDRFYRMNFTLAEESGTNYITAVYPRDNETIGDFTPELHAIAYTGLNGTVAFYVDSVFKTNQTIITDGVSVDVYYTTDTLTEGQHYWTAYYYPDEVGYNWTTGTQYFMTDSTYEGSDYSGPDIVEGFGSYLDSSLQTPYGGEIFALIFSGLVAGVIWYYSGSRKLEYLIAPMFFILACFSFIGLFPIWFLVLEVMVIAIFIFFKVR